MSVYLIFGGQQYYASGGANDLLDVATSLPVAQRRAGELIGKVIKRIEGGDYYGVYQEIEWTHVFDLINQKIVARCGERPYGYTEAVKEITTKDNA